MTPAPEFSHDWCDFDPRAYLCEYYSDIGHENQALLKFFIRAFHDSAPGCKLLDFGGGPTLNALIAAAPRVAEIHCSDYLEPNIREVTRWLKSDSSAWDWSPFVKATLELEGGGSSLDHIARREALIRERVTKVLKCDAKLAEPLMEKCAPYDIVMTNFCAESSTSEASEWRMMMRNIASLLKPQGRLVLTALQGAHSYSVGPKFFPAVNIQQEELVLCLCEAGFMLDSISMESIPADRPSRQYQGLLLAQATRGNAA